MEGLFDITDDSLVSGDKLLFTEKGEKKRICVRDPQIAAVDVHVVLRDKRRRLELCVKTDSRSCKYCDKAFVPSKRYCLRVFEYITRDSKTTLRLIPWVFGQDKLDGLRKALPKGASLKTSEWLLSCTNPTFQAFSIKFLPDCLLRKDENLKNLAIALSKRVKADGLSVLKALVSPSIPTETSKLDRYSQNQYHQERPQAPPSQVSSPQQTLPPVLPVLPQEPSMEDLDFGDNVGSEPAAPLTSVVPESLNPDTVVPGAAQEGPLPEEPKGEDLADWEKDLDAVLGDM